MNGKEAPEPERGYFYESSQPIYSLVMVAPFIALYEAGVYWLRSDIINGGDALLLNMGGPIMKWAGLEASLVSLLVLIACFLYRQFSTGGPWKIQARILLYLIFECLVYACILFLFLGYFVQFLSGAPPPKRTSHSTGAHSSADITPSDSVPGPVVAASEAPRTPLKPRPAPNPSPFTPDAQDPHQPLKPQIKRNANVPGTTVPRQSVTQMMPPTGPQGQDLQPGNPSNYQSPRGIGPDQPYAPKPAPHAPVPREIIQPPVQPVPQQPVQPPAPQVAQSNKPGLLEFVLFCGAGVYEELVFRVLLLGVLMPVFVRLLHMEHAYAAAWSTLVGAALFSAFHHVGSGADSFSAAIFLQRSFAGLFFSVIYLNRSFGVAAVTHSCYDIMVGLNLLV